MKSNKLRLQGAAALICCLIGVGPASATLFEGTLYYTLFTGGANIWKVDYSYDDSTNTFGLSSNTNIASTAGADGIIFGTNGNLLIGGQSSGNVYEVKPSDGTVVNTQATGTDSYHLALDPNGAKVYSSTFGGRLNTLSVPIGSGSTFTDITGDDLGLTQIAFGTGGNVFYVNGGPNGFGNVGLIDLSTGITDRLYTGVEAAHGLIYDPFTGLMTMFGAGKTGTFSAADGSGLLVSASDFACDFDQGSVDGKGHALVAGCGGITFLDYSLSLDITDPDYFTTIFGFSGIDDVAPLVGVGAPPGQGVPVPGTVLLVGAGLAAMLLRQRRSSTV